MIKDLVSVTIPVYNGRKDLPRALKSLKYQTYTNWECIIVNDGSTDGTKEYLDSLCDSRFRVFHFDKNKGRPYARQKALDEARGEFLAMLDADDFYDFSKIEQQVFLLKNNPKLSLISSRMCYFGENINILRKSKGFLVEKSFVKCVYPQVNIPPHGPCMLRIQRARDIKYNTILSYGEDSDFLHKYLSKYPFFGFMNTITYYYSAYDSISINDLKVAYSLKIKTSRSSKVKFISIFKYLYAVLVLPVIGLKFEIRRRGFKCDLKDYKKYKEVKRRLSNP